MIGSLVYFAVATPPCGKKIQKFKSKFVKYCSVYDNNRYTDTPVGGANQ